MSSELDKSKLIALALYEIRLLLSGYLGSNNDADKAVRIASHLSYALHNEALAQIESTDFDIEDALNKVKAIDNILEEEYSEYFIKKYNEKSV